MKFGGNATPAVSARLEDMSQMTIQTDQLGVNQSSGQNAMQVNYITKSGTNNFHGSLFETFQNSGLNANSWFNNAVGLPRATLIKNDFGGDIGGPIIHNKLFFFGSFATSRQPGAYTISSSGNGLDGYTGMLTPAAQAGLFTYTDNSGKLQTVNVLTQIAQPNGLPYKLNPNVASNLQAMDAAVKQAALSATADPNLNNVSWLVPSPVTQYYPDLRLDYDLSPALRVDFNYLQTDYSQPGANAPSLPGSYSNRGGGNYSSNYTTGLGVDWTVSPTMVNQFRGGFLYDANWFSPDAQPLYDTQPTINYALGFSGQSYQTPTSTYYPVVNFTDTLSWQDGAHLFDFGVDYNREQDHYWNPPLGYANVNLGINPSVDPAATPFQNSPYFANAPSSAISEAEALYATLTGRIESVNGQHAYDPATHQYLPGIGTYPLDELQQAWGLFFSDSYHATSDLTINYGLRFDHTSDNYDLTSAYTSATLANIYGPSGIGNLFKPGVLTGTNNPVLQASSHKYSPWNTAQPNLGFAWNPDVKGGILGSLMGGQNTVIRGGYAMIAYTEPQQFFWNTATDGGFNYYQSFALNEAAGGGTGNFAPGTLFLGNTLPAYSFTPTSFQTTVPMSDLTFSFSPYGADGMNPNIHQPYVESWNFGIQRQLGRSNAIEVRYVGNRSIHQWVALNPNEVNVFNNGFLAEFKAAQNNMKINAANGVSGSFADNGYAGQSALPILTTAGVSPTNGGIINDLNTGQVGSAASTLANNPNYLCNMVGSATFSPCTPYVGAGVAGAYPINFFQANPYGAGTEGPPYLSLGSAGYMTDVGYGNYNALQVDFRQKQWHGMEFNVNYTWAHTLGVEPGNSWTGSFNNFTMRNLRLSYGPTMFDIAQTFHAYGTYQLPFGRGKAFLNSPGIVNDVLGNWTVGTIITLQSGAPFNLTGGYQTFNDYADGGVRFTGSTLAALQSSVGVYNTGQAFADTFNPSFMVSPTGGGSNTKDFVPNTTPGTLASNYWLHGPGLFNQDLSLTKAIALTERWHLQLQGEFLNLYNDVQWGNPDSAVQSYYFGTAGVANQPRVVQFRANITF